MTNSFKKLVSTLTLAAAALVGSQSALHAIPISGVVEMQGVMQLDNTVLANANGTIVDPVNPEAYVTGITATGAYAGTGGSAVEWKAFSWDPITPLPLASLWSFTSGTRTYSFDLTSLTVVTHTSSFLDISGAGILKISDGTLGGPSYDDTVGLWSLQVNSAGGTSANSYFTFQSSNATPDGGTTALLVGVGLVGMSLVAHRRRLFKA